MKPIYLDHYDFIAELVKWQQSGPTEEKRGWTISGSYYWPNGTIRCEVSWLLLNGTDHSSCAGCTKYATTAQEAVWLVLEDLKTMQPNG